MKKINLLSPKTCTEIGLVVNIVLTIFKFIAGILGQSYAMIADAFHSFSDILATGISYLGILIGARPADKNHPYGHGNAETIAALFIALLVFATGVYISITSYLAIIKKDIEIPLNIALIAAVVSIIVKELLYRYTIKVGKITNSPALISSAWDHRSDAYSSIAALLGIIGAKFIIWYLDPLAGIIVSVLIFKISFKLIRLNIGILMDEKPNPVIIKNIKSAISKINEIKRIDSIKAHPRGSTYTIDLEIAVDKNFTVEEGHKIAAQVKKCLLKQVDYIQDVMVHVNPYNNNK